MESADTSNEHHMKPPAGLQSARSDARAPPPDRKRKRSNRQPSSEDTGKQQTLQSLFAGQQKPHVNGGIISPNGKRLKPDETHLPNTPPRSLATSDMYTFSSRSPVPNGNGVIDLTNGSPPTSPQSRRVNGAINGAVKRTPGINAHTVAKKLVVKNLKTNTDWDS